MPIGALLGNERALSGFNDLSTGSTWSWLPAACAASLAYLDLMEREDVLGNVRALHEVAVAMLVPLVDRIRRSRRRPRAGRVRRHRVRLDTPTKERAARAAGGGRRRVHPAWRAGRVQHHQPQHPAVAGDVARGVRRGARPGASRRSRKRSRRPVNEGLRAASAAALAAMADDGHAEGPTGAGGAAGAREPARRRAGRARRVLERLPRVWPPIRAWSPRRSTGVQRYGAGTASVRFICGTFTPHLELERDLANLVGTEAALTFVSCWDANAAAIATLADERTVVLSDALNHASIIDAVRVSRAGRKVVYPHVDLGRARRCAVRVGGVGPPHRGHRRGVQHGGRCRAAARPDRAVPPPRRRADGRRLPRRRGDGRRRSRAPRRIKVCSARSTS